MKVIRVLNILTGGILNDGITNFATRHLCKLNSKEMAIDFASYKIEESARKKIISENIEVYDLPNRKRVIKYIVFLSKFIRDGHYDIIHVHGSSSIMCIEMIAGILGGCKIRISHSHNTTSRHLFFHTLLKPIFNLTYTDAVACGKDAGEWLFGKKDFTILKNALDIDKFKYNEKIRKKYRNELNIDNKILLGMVGTYNYQKNHDFLIDIFVKLNINKKYKLIMFGDGGDLKESIIKKICDLKLEDDIIVKGNVNNIYDYIQACDIMLLPSKYEGFPNVVIEWQASNLPCIISDKITKDVKLTNLVKFESIDNGVDNWVDAINNINIKDRKNNYKEVLKRIIDNGFELNCNVNYIKNYYNKLINKRKK